MVAEVLDAYVDVFHQVGGEGFEGGVGVGCLDLRFEFFRFVRAYSELRAKRRR